MPFVESLSIFTILFCLPFLLKQDTKIRAVPCWFWLRLQRSRAKHYRAITTHLLSPSPPIFLNGGPRSCGSYQPVCILQKSMHTAWSGGGGKKVFISLTRFSFFFLFFPKNDFSVQHFEMDNKFSSSIYLTVSPFSTDLLCHLWHISKSHTCVVQFWTFYPIPLFNFSIPKPPT